MAITWHNAGGPYLNASISKQQITELLSLIPRPIDLYNITRQREKNCDVYRRRLNILSNNIKKKGRAKNYNVIQNARDNDRKGFLDRKVQRREFPFEGEDDPLPVSVCSGKGAETVFGVHFLSI